MRKTLDIQVVAESVETAGQIGRLLDMGAEYAQGFYFHRVLRSDELQEYLAGAKFAR